MTDSTSSSSLDASDYPFDCDMLVLGAGPGGYSAAFRSADLGMKTILVERHGTLGGVCLNVGCIPSKALLHVAAASEEALHLETAGFAFAALRIDLDRLRKHKSAVVEKLTGGLAGMAKARKVEIVQGIGRFSGPNSVEVVDASGACRTIRFAKAIVAAGSRSVKLPFLPDDPRIVDSTGALELRQIPKRMLIIGGGIIGLEMATIYSALGSRITVAELGPHLVPSADRDLIKVWEKFNAHRFDRILTSTGVAEAKATEEGIQRDGKTIKALVQANKNGHMYTLDRTNGKFISSVPFVNVDWGTVDQKTGRMVVKPGKKPEMGKAAEFCPSYFGGKDWAHVSYNPQMKVAFIPSIEMCVSLTDEETSYKRGSMYLGANGEMVAPGKGHLTAVDLTSNKVLWNWNNASPLQSSSALSTAGNVVFVGTLEGKFVAVDAKSGKQLWDFQTNSGIVGGPITYSVDGKQYVAVVSGYGGAFPLWAGKGVPEHLKKVNKGGTLWVFEVRE